MNGECRKFSSELKPGYKKIQLPNKMPPSFYNMSLTTLIISDFPEKSNVGSYSLLRKTLIGLSILCSHHSETTKLLRIILKMGDGTN